MPVRKIWNVRSQDLARIRLEQADPEVLGLVDPPAIGLEPSVGDAEDELGAEDALEVHAVDDLFHARQHLIRKLDLADAESAATAFEAEPAEVEAAKLPERIEAKAPRHDGIALEVTRKEPEVRPNLEFRADHALAVRTTRLADLRDTIEHQHGRQRKLGIP